jgi:hypothetical protein
MNKTFRYVRPNSRFGSRPRDYLKETASVGRRYRPALEVEGAPSIAARRPDRWTITKVVRYPGRGHDAPDGADKMLIPHWLIGLAIFGGPAAFIGFAFGQGLKVKPDRNKDPNDWSQYGGPPSDGTSPPDGGHFG